MPRLSVFDQVSLDGFFVDAAGDMSWAHRDDPEWAGFAAGNARSGSALVFGRVTYEMMAGFWPTPQARQASPDVAEAMNAAPKIVFSRSLAEATWSNTRLIRGDLVGEMRRLKDEPGPDMVILGSGTLVSQLTRARLVDAYQIVVCPVILGRGRTLFEGPDTKLALELAHTRRFGNGNVVLWYEQPSAR